MSSPLPTDQKAPRVRQLLKSLLAGAIFGLAGLLVIVSDLYVLVPGTNLKSDAREIFVLLGAALTGPFGGALAGLVSTLMEPPPESQWSYMVGHVLTAMVVGWLYARYIATRSRKTTRALAWMLLVFAYYFVLSVAVLNILSFLAPSVFHFSISSHGSFLEDYALLLRSWFPEFFLTCIITSIVLLILPWRYQSLEWIGKHTTPRPRRSLRLFDRWLQNWGGWMSVRLTLWFILLSIIPVIVVNVFVNDQVSQAVLTFEAGKQREVARMFSRDITEHGLRAALSRTKKYKLRPGQNLFVLDTTGRYVAHLDSTKVGTLATNDFLATTIAKVFVGMPGVTAEAASGLAIGHAKIEGTEWFAVSIQTRDVIEHALVVLRNTINVKLGASLVIVSLVGGFIIFALVGRPLRKLTRAAREVGSGNLEVSVDTADMEDEIGLLALTFNEMTGNLNVMHRAMGSEIVQRKSTEEALRLSEKQFRLLAENSTDMISRHDLEGRYLYASPACRLLLGVEPGEILGRSAYDFVHPDDMERVATHHREHLSNKSAPPLIFRVLRSDGSVIWSESESRLVPESDGRGAEIHVSSRDVTRRMAVQLALKESEERLRTVVSNVPVVLFALDRQGIFTMSEGKGLQAIGLKPGQAVGLSVFDVYKDFPQVVAEVRAALSGQARDTVIDLGNVVFETSLTPVLSPGGGVDGVIGVAGDVTARMRAEEAVRESEKMFKILVHQSSDPIYLIQNNRLAFVNPAWEATFGYSAAEATSDTFDVLCLVAPESRQYVQDRLKLYARNEPVSKRYEMTGLRRDGTRIDLDVSVAMVSWMGMPAVQGIYRDITERKKTEESVRHMQKTESLGVLAGGIAHDFNNLLQSMIGQTSLALRKLLPENPAHENVLKAERAAERAADLTRQLLAYSGRGTFNVRPLDLNKLIHENLHFLELAIPKDIALEVDLAHELPLIKADAGQMQQVVMNLIINASEAIGLRLGRILIRTNVTTIDAGHLDEWTVPEERVSVGRYVKLDVSDNGSGMSQEVLKKIFDPFFTTKVTGRGLGLSAVVGIIKGHHGALRVESEEDRGTTFSLVVPVSEETKKEHEMIHEAPNVQNLQGCVLIVDDEADVREVVIDMLDDAGVRTMSAASGEEGIAIFQSHPDEVDLVLLDLSMPGIGGKETFRRLKALKPDLKIVLSSGYNQSEVTEDLSHLGLTGFIQKPYRYDKLNDLIRKYLEGSSPS